MGSLFCRLAYARPSQWRSHTSPVRTAVPDYFAAGDFRGILLFGRRRQCAGKLSTYAGAIMVLFVLW